MLAIWHIRPALQRRFPLHKGIPNDYVRFLAWCAGDGRRLFAILRDMPEWEEALSQRIELPDVRGDFWKNGFSVDMFLHGVAMYRYTLGPILHHARIRHLVACDYWHSSRKKRLYPSPPQWQCDFLQTRFGNPEKFFEVLRKSLVRGRFNKASIDQNIGMAEISVAFNTKKEPVNRVEGVKLCDSEVVRLSDEIKGYLPKLPLKMIRSLVWIRERFYTAPSENQIASVTALISSAPRDLPRIDYPFGVNLFGYASGELGIGEDVRSVAQALQALNIPFCIVNVKLAKNISQQDSSVDQWVVSEPRFAINIFCTTGIEQVRYLCVHGLEVMQGRYNIGFWPWELPAWPVSCRYAYSLVDEIWGISSYTASAYEDSDRPVYAMTLPVSIDSIAPRSRGDFGLPEKDYLFVFSFDFNSRISRKNPAGVIEAFQRAFPLKSNDAVGLVIKVSHASEKNSEWRRIQAMIRSDSRIHLINETLRRSQLLALYKCCDCYVSLHRAEGFGRSLAEALLLDKQLIATGYSGNMDYCSEDRVGLVKYRIRNLELDEYFHGAGQHWAEPDTGHAVELMRQIYVNPKSLHPKTFDFNPASVGLRFSQRLNELKQQLELSVLPQD